MPILSPSVLQGGNAAFAWNVRCALSFYGYQKSLQERIFADRFLFFKDFFFLDTEREVDCLCMDIFLEYLILYQPFMRFPKMELPVITWVLKLKQC